MKTASLFLVAFFLSFAESTTVFCNQETDNRCVAECLVKGKNVTLNITDIISYPHHINVDPSSPDADTVKSFVYSCQGDDNQCGDVERSAVCVTDTDSKVSSCGSAEVEAKWELIQTTPNYLFIITYRGGDCVSLNCKQSTFTFVQTSENDISVDFTRTDMDGSIEVYLFDVSGPCVGQPNCGKTPTGSTNSASSIAGYIGLTIIAIALLGVSGYCIIGSLIMYFGRGARGKEVIPNIQFWTSTVGLVKGGCLFVVRPCHKKQSYAPL